MIFRLYLVKCLLILWSFGKDASYRSGTESLCNKPQLISKQPLCNLAKSLYLLLLMLLHGFGYRNKKKHPFPFLQSPTHTKSIRALLREDARKCSLSSV